MAGTTRLELATSALTTLCLGKSKTRTTKARDTDSSAVGADPALNSHAKQAAARAVVFRVTMRDCAWVDHASNDDKWHRSDAATVAGRDMKHEAYCDRGGLGHRKRQKIATTLAQVLAYLLAASCVVAQTGKLSAEKQAKIESTISNFRAASKVPGWKLPKMRQLIPRRNQVERDVRFLEAAPVR
jgi:hypothetical protein